MKKPDRLSEFAARLKAGQRALDLAEPLLWQATTRWRTATADMGEPKSSNPGRIRWQRNELPYCMAEICPAGYTKASGNDICGRTVVLPSADLSTGPVADTVPPLRPSPPSRRGSHQSALP